MYDCRPPLLPVPLQLEDIGPLPLRPTVVSASLAAPPREDGMAASGVSPEGVAIPELGVAPLVDSETDMEDELPTPDDSPSMRGLSSGVRPAPPDVIDLELEKALLNVSILPVMVTPIVDPVVGSVFVSGTSSCTAERRPRPYIADLSTPGGGRQSDPGCLSVVPHVARLLRI